MQFKNGILHDSVPLLVDSIKLSAIASISIRNIIDGIALKDSKHIAFCDRNNFYNSLVLSERNKLENQRSLFH